MKYHIIGCGISGLSLGYYLKKLGHSVKLYEATAKAGGVISTNITPHGLVQHGPHLMRENNIVAELFQTLDVRYHSSQTNKKHIVSINGTSLKGVHFNSANFCNTVKHFFYNRKNGYASLEHFAQHHYGNFITRNIIQSVANGIYATNIANLDCEIALQKLYFTEKKAIYKIMKNLKNMRPSNIIAPVGGFQTLIEKLQMALSDEILYNATIEDVSHLEGKVFITIPAFSAAKLQNIPVKLQKILENIRYESIDVTTVFTQKPINFHGIGMLSNSQTGILGVLFNSDAFPNTVLAGMHSYSVFSKNLFEHDIVDFFEKTLNTKPVMQYFNVYTNSLPIYNKDVKNFINCNNGIDGNVKFFSNYTGSVAVGQIICKAKEIACNENGH